MPTDIEAVVREHLGRVLFDIEPEQIELDGDLVNDYGLTSLNRVLFLTSLCEESGVDLGNFTAEDVSSMRTMQDVVDSMAKHLQKVS